MPVGALVAIELVACIASRPALFTYHFVRAVSLARFVAVGVSTTVAVASHVVLLIAVLER